MKATLEKNRIVVEDKVKDFVIKQAFPLDTSQKEIEEIIQRAKDNYLAEKKTAKTEEAKNKMIKKANKIIEQLNA